MSRLADHAWAPYYSPSHGDLVSTFYIPVLGCAQRYDRVTGYFSATALSVAARGVEGLILNNGRMRMVVGHTLGHEEAEAIAQGESLRETLEAGFRKAPLDAEDSDQREALELLAWMVAQGYLEVKVAVPCDGARRPLADTALFHPKAGIIEDKVGDRLAFNGSINETLNGWRHNVDTFHVFKSWGGGDAHVDAEEREFQALWVDKSPSAITIDVPQALREDLLRYAPEDDTLPVRLKRATDGTPSKPVETTPASPAPEAAPEPAAHPRQIVWSFLAHAPTFANGGERVGEATSTIDPWPHQVRAFERMYLHWPSRLLIADEVGLGKTIQAGLLLRQAWMSGRAHRVLIMAPKSVVRQWQIELREKFNLNWPIYDGKQLNWAPSPALGPNPVQKVGRHDWHEHAPCVITSSHLMRRTDRAQDLLNDARPWDLVIVDEAHHARRRAGGTGTDDRPNQLLRLLRRLKGQTDGLVLLTATPMQVSPVEVWDLLDLLGLPSDWNLDAFQQYFEAVGKPNPSEHEMAFMARMFRAVEATWGPVDQEEAKQAANVKGNIKLKRILRALREESTIPLKMLETDERKAAQRLLKLNTPVKRLISRHTRNLLKRYYEAGKITTPIADRSVDDTFVTLTQSEREVYERVEEYITSTYNNASQERRTAIGFVMTIYRRRLASSFYALQHTLEMRLAALTGSAGDLFESADIEEDLPDDDVAAEVSDSEQAEEYERDALKIEEKGDLEALLEDVRRLPPDTKAKRLKEAVGKLRDEGYGQVMVFTQFTDTMDFLRDFLAKDSDLKVMCYSGRGGEVLRSGSWDRISRDDIKARFRKRDADVLVCTDAAAEGLNFQFCGAIVNYDMPWNPMRVEQRIGRIDRVGQQHGTIKVMNLHYQDTVETDVYLALRERLNLFETFVGRLQPILSKLPKAIEGVALSQTSDRQKDTEELVEDLRGEAAEAEESGFDLDKITEGSIEEKRRPDPPYGLQELAQILQRADIMPQGDQVEKLGPKDCALLRPGMTKSVRVTTDPEHFEEHAESLELWSPGSPLFPNPEDVRGAGQSPSTTEFQKALNS